MGAPLRNNESLPVVSTLKTSSDEKKSGRFPHPVLVVFITFIVFLLGQFLGAIIVSLLAMITGLGGNDPNEWVQNNPYAQAGFVITAEILIIALVFLVLKVRNLKLADIGIKRPKKNVALVAVAALITYYILYGFIGTIILKLFPGLNIDQEQDIGFTEIVGYGEVVVAFVSIVIIVPLAEEIITRGLLFSGLRARLNFFWTLTITSALFGIAHLQTTSANQFTWALVINIFFLALVLGWLREKTGTIWAGVAMHALVNLVAFSIRFQSSIF